jgi:hypothetical protein
MPETAVDEHSESCLREEEVGFSRQVGWMLLPSLHMNLVQNLFDRNLS